MTITPEAALAILDDHTKSGINPGLSRMHAAVELLADPQSGYPTIHVAGTNGKTSTARMCASILTGLGFRTGLYTSPHLVDVYERFEIDGEPVKPATFAERIEYLQPIMDEVERICDAPLSYFELCTVIAFELFSDSAVSAAVVETGMGGSWDATNIVDAHVAVITNVGLDHTEYLGERVVDICAEKAGIIKAGSHVITGVREPALLEVIAERIETVGAGPLWRLGEEIQIEDSEPAVGGRLLSMSTPNGGYQDVFVSLLGQHQSDNAALAIAACEAFVGSQLQGESVVASLSDVTSPARLEILQRHPLVVLDGAHNGPGARALAQSVQEALAYDNCVLVLGILKSKDAQEIVDALLPIAGRVIVTRPSDDGDFRDPTELAQLVEESGPGVEVIETTNVSEALRIAYEVVTPDDLILITGSLYMAGEARALLSQD